MVPSKWACLAVSLLLRLAMSSAQRSLLVDAKEREPDPPAGFHFHEGIKEAGGPSGYGGWPLGGGKAGQGSHDVPTVDMGASSEGDMPGMTMAKPSDGSTVHQYNKLHANRPNFGDQPVNGGFGNPSGYDGSEPISSGYPSSSSTGTWQSQSMYCTPVSCLDNPDKSGGQCPGFSIFIDFRVPSTTGTPYSNMPSVMGHPDAGGGAACANVDGSCTSNDKPSTPTAAGRQEGPQNPFPHIDPNSTGSDMPLPSS